MKKITEKKTDLERVKEINKKRKLNKRRRGEGTEREGAQMVM